jgi:hypothetical protein
VIELAPKSDCEMTVDEAFLYCITLQYNGYNDWRLPTEFEYGYYAGLSFSWYTDRDQSEFNWPAIPVRDIK